MNELVPDESKFSIKSLSMIHITIIATEGEIIP